MKSNVFDTYSPLFNAIIVLPLSAFVNTVSVVFDFSLIDFSSLYSVFSLLKTLNSFLIRLAA